MVGTLCTKIYICFVRGKEPGSNYLRTRENNYEANVLVRKTVELAEIFEILKHRLNAENNEAHW